MPKKPSAILFDLDDTILEFHAIAAPAWIAAIEQFADRWNGHSTHDVHRVIDRIAAAWWSDPERHRRGRLHLSATRQQHVTEALIELGVDDGKLPRSVVDVFETLRFQGLRLFPGARATLDHFKAAGVPMALVTNGDSVGQRAKIERFDLAPYFACILIEGEFGAGKPEEHVFHHALGELGVEATDAWMVGDRLPWEIEPCHRLGMFTVWVDWQGTGLPANTPVQPHRIVRQIDELIT